MPSALKLTGTTFTNSSLPKLEKDIIILTAGALWLFDAANPDSVPLSTAVNGTWRNLVRTQPDAVIKSAQGLTLGGNGLIFDESGSWLNAGTTYNLTAKQLVMTGLFKFQLLPGGFSAVMGRGNSGGSNNQFMFGSVNATPSTTVAASVFLGTGSTIAPVNGFMTNAAVGTIYHIAMGITWTGTVTTQTLWLNGVNVATNTGTGTGLAAPPNVANIGIARYDGLGDLSAYKGSIYRLYAEDLGVSGRTVAQVVAADYAVATIAARYS